MEKWKKLLSHLKTKDNKDILFVQYSELIKAGLDH